MYNMPEKIWVYDFIDETATAIKDNNSYATEYVHKDLYEVLEAENKMLAEAVKKALMFGVSNGAQVVLNEALAQRIGGK